MLRMIREDSTLWSKNKFNENVHSENKNSEKQIYISGGGQHTKDISAYTYTYTYTITNRRIENKLESLPKMRSKEME